MEEKGRFSFPHLDQDTTKHKKTNNATFPISFFYLCSFGGSRTYPGRERRERPPAATDCRPSFSLSLKLARALFSFFHTIFAQPPRVKTFARFL